MYVCMKIYMFQLKKTFSYITNHAYTIHTYSLCAITYCVGEYTPDVRFPTRSETN